MALIKSVGDIRSRREPVRVEVPEWGGHVFARPLSGREFERWQLSLMAQSKGENPRTTLERLKGNNARLVVLGACDESGESIFTDRDIPVLMDADNRGLQRVADAITKLSRVSDEEEAVAEFEGNSEPDQTSSSTTGWPGTSEG